MEKINDIISAKRALLPPILYPLFSSVFHFLAMVFSTGVSYLEYIDLNSLRNLFVVGISLYIGTGVPKYYSETDKIRPTSESPYKKN